MIVVVVIIYDDCEPNSTAADTRIDKNVILRYPGEGILTLYKIRHDDIYMTTTTEYTSPHIYIYIYQVFGHECICRWSVIHYYY